jgi:hypothetical protein
MVMTQAGSRRSGALSRLMRALDGLKREARANPRVLAGLAAILLLLWGYGLIGLVDAVDASARRLADAELELRRATGLAGESGWEARVAEAEGLKARLIQRLWVAETEGQAMADFQEAMSKAARESGIGRVQVRVDRDPTQAQASGLRVFNATIGGDFAPEALSNFLLKLEATDRFIQVRTLRTVRQPIARLDMTVATYHGPPTQGACTVPSILPPGFVPARATPAGAAPAGAAPTGAAPAMALPPGVLPPGGLPPGVAPPVVLPPGALPPGLTLPPAAAPGRS